MLSSLPGCSAGTPSPAGSKQLGGRRLLWDRTPLAEDAHRQLAHVPASAPAQESEGLELAGTDEFLALETAAEVDGNAGKLDVPDPVCVEEGSSGGTDGNAGEPAVLGIFSLSCRHCVPENAATDAVSDKGEADTPTSNSLSGMKKAALSLEGCSCIGNLDKVLSQVQLPRFVLVSGSPGCKLPSSNPCHDGLAASRSDQLGCSML